MVSETSKFAANELSLIHFWVLLILIVLLCHFLRVLFVQTCTYSSSAVVSQDWNIFLCVGRHSHNLRSYTRLQFWVKIWNLWQTLYLH